MLVITCIDRFQLRLGQVKFLRYRLGPFLNESILGCARVRKGLVPVLPSELCVLVNILAFILQERYHLSNLVRMQVIRQNERCNPDIEKLGEFLSFDMGFLRK